MILSIIQFYILYRLNDENLNLKIYLQEFKGHEIPVKIMIQVPYCRETKGWCFVNFFIKFVMFNLPIFMVAISYFLKKFALSRLGRIMYNIPVKFTIFHINYGDGQFWKGEKTIVTENH